MAQNKMFRRGTVLVGAIAIGAALTLSGCGGSSKDNSETMSGAAAASDCSGKQNIVFWHGFTGGAGPTLVPKMVDQFNAEHPDVQVKQVPQEWADINAKMPMAIKSGKGPDVAVLHGDDIATYAAQKLLVSADSLIDDLGYTDKDFPPGVFDGGNYADTQWAVPFSITPLGLYANMSVLKEAGITEIPADKETYLSALQKLKEAGVQGEWVDGYVFTGLFEFESLLWQFGGDLYNEDVTEATFNSDAGVKALTWMTDLISDGYSPANVTQDGNINALIAGETAFNWNGIWQTTNSALDDVEWKAAPVPEIGTQKAVWSSSTHWVFPANKGQDTCKTAAAGIFVKWMNDHSLEWAETGELPAANVVRDDPALVEKYPNLAPFMDELDYAHYETSSPGISEANAFITTAVNEALNGKKTPKEALDEAKVKADQILEQNRSKYVG